jgi:hypothetical protein
VETEAVLAEESPGAALARVLAAQRTFLENVYSLLRFVEAEATKSGWELVRNGGYGITRNGMGRGLTSFATGDWAISQAGIAFVRPGQAQLVQGVTNTQIPPEGLELLVFQVRWLDRAPAEPVVWYGKLLVEPEGTAKPRKWEEYQNMVFFRLEPDVRSSETRAGNVRPGRASISGSAVVFTGRYAEVPVTAIQNEQDVISQLVEPALAD